MAAVNPVTRLQSKAWTTKSLRGTVTPHTQLTRESVVGGIRYRMRMADSHSGSRIMYSARLGRQSIQRRDPAPASSRQWTAAVGVGAGRSSVCADKRDCRRALWGTHVPGEKTPSRHAPYATSASSVKGIAPKMSPAIVFLLNRDTSSEARPPKRRARVATTSASMISLPAKVAAGEWHRR